MTTTERLDDALILIVDDFEDALEIYDQYLTFQGYRVITAASGLGAIALTLRHRPAVIFMDLQMGTMTGTQTMLALRSDPSFQIVPIVALTARALADERAEALRVGFDEVIVKPCLPDELMAAVDRLLGIQHDSPQTS